MLGHLQPPTSLQDLPPPGFWKTGTPPWSENLEARFGFTHNMEIYQVIFT